MTISLNVNGVVYPFPEPDDENWGQNVTDWAQAVTGGMLQKAGGNFSLTADANFGATYGLVSTYFKSRQSNISATGAIRLARADVIGWRNQANSGDLPLGVNSSDQLTFNGTSIQNTLSVTDTTTIDLTLAADVLSADVVAGSLTNTQINASAAIALTKLAATTASRALVSDGSGFVTAATTTATEIGYVNGVTSAIQTQLDAKVAKSLYAAKGTLLGASGAATPVALAVGTNGQILTADSGETSGLKWTSGLTNPMDGAGQMIYGGTGGAATKLAAGTSNQVLQSNGAGAPTWVSLVNANIDAAAAIAFSKLAALTSGNILVGSASNVATSVAMTGDITISDAGVTAISSGVIVNADISASAAIAYSKLSLTNSIVNADINSSAAIAYSKLNLSSSIVNADISASAAIAYSKLNLSSSIVNADISASAAIAFSKLAALSSGNILVGSAGNVATSVAVTGDVTISNAGVTAIASGVIVNADISASAAIDFSKLAALSSGNILVGSVGNVATSVAVTGDVTISNAGVTAIASGVIVNADINASAAIAVSKLAAVTASRALVSDSSGFIAVSAVTSTELGYLSGVTSPTGSGALVLATSPTLVTPTLGVASATSLGIGGAVGSNRQLYTTVSANSAQSVTFENTSNGASAQMQFQVKSDTVTGILASVGSGGTAQTIVGTTSAHPLHFHSNGNTRGNISSAGLWTIGVTNTAAQCDIVGATTVLGSELSTVLALGNSVATAGTNRVILEVRYTTDTDITGGRFISCRNNAGTVVGMCDATSNTAVTWTTPSDSRLKTKPAVFDGLDLVTKIETKEFSWKDGTGVREKGVYAQELYKVLPELVRVGDDERTNDDSSIKNPWSVDYSKLSVVAVRAIQQLNEIIEAMRAEIKDLKAKVFG